MNPNGLTPAQALSTNISAFESIGVRYVVEQSNGTDPLGRPFPAAGAPAWPAGPRLDYHDTFAEIWELPSATPLFQLKSARRGATNTAGANVAARCTVHWSGVNQVTAQCSHPSVLVRHEQFMPGWSATVDGKRETVTVSRAGPKGLFQSVFVPAGKTDVTSPFFLRTSGSPSAHCSLPSPFWRPLSCWSLYAEEPRNRKSRKSLARPKVNAPGYLRQAPSLQAHGTPREPGRRQKAECRRSPQRCDRTCPGWRRPSDPLPIYRLRPLTRDDGWSLSHQAH
jgi:hypothetical protein